MKKYVKPELASEMFVTNEYISSCLDQGKSISCLNMNTASLYKETNGTKGLQTGNGGDTRVNQNTDFDGWNWDEKSDCYRTGDASGALHTSANTSIDENAIYYVVTGNETTEAYLAKSIGNGFSDAPHFVSITQANHS